MVYLARDLKHNRLVAVKVLHPEIAGTLGAARFLREIAIAARLSHPNIVPLYDSGEAAGSLYYIMPFVEGRSLRELLTERNRLPVDEAVQITCEVADALDYAHAHDVVHRDIKPENILLQAGHPVVTDFGIARAVSAASTERLTSEHLAIGTPAYMSPEQAGGGNRVDGRADVYSLASVLYEMIAGVVPFNGPASRLATPHISVGALRRPRTGGQAIPPAVEHALERALAAEPSDRFGTAAEFSRALRIPTRRWRRTLVGLTAVFAVAVAATLVLTRLRLPSTAGATVLVPHRVVVSQFANRTGQRDLDYLGVMAADWITEGMLRAGVVDVVPTPTALQASLFTESDRARHPSADPLRTLAEETGAGIVITGSYYMVEQRLQVQAQVVDIRTAKLLGALAPVLGPAIAPTKVIDDVRARLMGLVATALDERFAASVAAPMQPPTFEAYREFSEGLDGYVRTDFRLAADRFAAAYRSDSMFPVALLMASISLSNDGAYARADSLLNILASSRTQLSPYHRNWLDYRRSVLAGDRPAALRSIRLIAAAAPGTKATYNLAIEALQNGELDEAARALETLVPDRGPMRGWAPYWDAVGTVRHLKGDYRGELRASEQARTAYPDRLYVLGSAVRALAAMGMLARLDQVLDAAARLKTDPYGTTFGSLALDAGVELRAHGHAEAASRYLQRSLEWYDKHDSSASRGVADQLLRAQVLYQLGRLNEARAAAETVAHVDTRNSEYLGMLGAIAARSGDSSEVARVSRALAELPRKYSIGAPSVSESRVAAILGQQDRAVALLRQAFSEGRAYDLWIHRDVDLVGLHGYAPFVELMKPKGH